jgi:PAS domain S-box-containing protein
MTSYSLSIELLGLVIVAGGLAIAWSMSRRFRQDLGIKKGEREKKEDVGFIIDAFHSVTKQLKEKELELERLRASAEQRAENVESYNENILQCVTSGVMTFDRIGKVMTLNRAAEEMLGINHEQAVNRPCSEIFGSGDICRSIGETIGRTAASVRLETTLERPAGRMWLGYNTAILTDRQGSSLGVILSFSDLTEVKRLQEQVELRERLTALGEMSAGIAHELRNPMAVIAGYLALVSKKSAAPEQKIIRDVVTEINGMNRIIDDLLTFARPASLNRVRINIRELIEGCVANVLQAKGGDARTRTVLDLPELDVSLDEVLMRQALTNLVQNAVEAMPEGGTLTIRGMSTGRELSLTITDTGCGIPRDAFKKIFLPFFTTKDTGVGLGLALVHKIVLSHGGRIDVQSNEERGTTFRVILPTAGK